ncbi:MAG: SDR family oxidoreductase [Melioribacter sp.]|nr:SDR family oxidoreductase [Melioribacter sp.]
MKIFITGGSGLLGQYLNRTLSKHYNILTQYNEHIGNCNEFKSIKLSLIDFEKLESVINEFKPNIIVHTAAISNAHRAENYPSSYVYNINVNVTKKLAELCDKIGAKLIYISTDLVYAGYRGSYLNENSKLIPISLYAETKLMGEIKIQETFDNYLILRQALLFGFGLNHSKCFFQEIYEKLKSNMPIKLFTNQYRSPLEISDAARMILELINKDIKKEIINFGGQERLSRYQLGEFLCEEAGFDKSLLIGTTMEEENYPYIIHDVSLNIDKLKSFGVCPKSVKESIREILKSN